MSKEEPVPPLLGMRDVIIWRGNEQSYYILEVYDAATNLTVYYSSAYEYDFDVIRLPDIGRRAAMQYNSWVLHGRPTHVNDANVEYTPRLAISLPRLSNVQPDRRAQST